MSLREHIKVPKLVQLYDYWDAKRRGRQFPSRADIEPTELAFILGNLGLVEVAGDPPVFRFRLSGSEIDHDEGFTMQGKTLDDYPLPEHRESIRRIYMGVLGSGEPSYEELERQNEGALVRYARLVLPLASDGSSIDMLLIGRIALTPRELRGGRRRGS